VDPNKPIDIPFDAGTGTYNARDAAFVAQQSAGTVGQTLDSARAAGTAGGGPAGDLGNDGGTWEMKNGPAAGVLYSAATIGAGAYMGYTSARDQADLASWCSVEIGDGLDTSGKRNKPQTAGSYAQGGQGPVQLTPPYYSTTGAYSPGYAAVVALAGGDRVAGGHQPNVRWSILSYNVGNPQLGDSLGQTESGRGGGNYTEGQLFALIDAKLNWPGLGV